jgi:hypothetical protein
VMLAMSQLVKKKVHEAPHANRGGNRVP